MVEDETESEDVPEPIVSGAIVAKEVAKELALPKLGELLLGPTFKAYGDHWGEAVGEKLRARKDQKKASNLVQHIEHLSKSQIEFDFDKISNDPQFDEWLEGASRVDPSLDMELAQFWKSGFVALNEGGLQRNRQMRLIKKLDADDAAYLAAGTLQQDRFFKPGNSTNASDYVKRLTAAGVFDEHLFPGPWSSNSRNSWLLIVLAFFLFVYAFLPELLGGFVSKEAFSEYLSPVVIATVLSLIGITYFAGKVTTDPSFPKRLTDDGVTLIKNREKYLQS